MGDFPWDLLKAETLRMLCRDLGFKGLRRDNMIEFLSTTEGQGLGEALKLNPPHTPHKARENALMLTSPITPLKKRMGTVVSDYNTRHRDKRVRVSDPGPLRKRAQPPKPKPGGHQVDSSRKAARRIKNILKHKSNNKELRLLTKEVFDGIELPTPRLAKGKGKAQAQGEVIDQQDEAEVESPFDEKLPEQNGGLSRELSSLAGSNKENELHQTLVGDANSEDGQVGTNPSPQRVLENAVTTLDEDADAEGEVVGETDEVVAHPPAAPVVDVNHLTTESVNNLERMLRTTLANGQP